MARSAVLFVDDGPAVLEGIELVFRREASEVLTATSARDALEILASRRADVVVSDECMPQVSGAELLATVAERYPEVIRIMLTGHASLSAATRAINGGLYRFLSKPFEPEELQRVVRDALKVKSSRAERARLGTH